MAAMPGRMVVEEISSRRRPSPPPRHEFGDGRLGDFDPELPQLPWMRGAPHSRLARLISRIRRRISAETFGRPPRQRDFQRQYKRKPVRCHRMIVSGWTMGNAVQTPTEQRWSQTKSSRSAS